MQHVYSSKNLRRHHIHFERHIVQSTFLVRLDLYVMAVHVYDYKLMLQMLSAIRLDSHHLGQQ